MIYTFLVFKNNTPYSRLSINTKEISYITTPAVPAERWATANKNETAIIATLGLITLKVFLVRNHEMPVLLQMRVAEAAELE